MNEPKPLPVARDLTVTNLIKEIANVYPPSETREVLLAKYAARADFGFKKYGQTTHDRTDISMKGWFVHLQEEAMDATVYAVRLLRDLPTDSPVHHELYAHLRHMMQLALFATDNIRALDDLEAADQVG